MFSFRTSHNEFAFVSVCVHRYTEIADIAIHIWCTSLDFIGAKDRGGLYVVVSTN